MTPWSWWAGTLGEDCYDLACECPTREEAIRQALRLVAPGEQFQIVEARSSEDAKYEGSDLVPFLRTRNHEALMAGPTRTPPGVGKSREAKEENQTQNLQDNGKRAP